MLEVNTGLISWTIVTFVLLLIVLRKFAWKPLLEGLQRREERVRTSIERAEQAQKDAERLMEENRQRLAQADQERTKVTIVQDINPVLTSSIVAILQGVAGYG